MQKKRTISNAALSTSEVIALFVIGTIGRRLLDSWINPLELAVWLQFVIKILFVSILIIGALAGHMRLIKYLVSKGWLDEHKN